MKYPENERILIVRPCLKYICLGNKPAAKLLSLLLYYSRNCDEKEAIFSFTTTQEELIADLIDEMDVKTLHRTAIPLLRLLGFLEVDGSSYRYKYTIHLDYIQYLLANYKDKQEVAEHTVISIKEQLDKLPIEQRLSYPLVFDRMQLDKCLIEIDKCPIELDKLPIQLEECLIPFRQMSNSKRGRKPRPQAAVEALSENVDSNRDITDRLDTREVFATAHTAPAQSENEYHFYGTDKQHLIWNCQNWCAAQHGTCEDYVAAIENGWREAETGKQAAVQIGATDGNNDRTSRSHRIFARSPSRDAVYTGSEDTREAPGYPQRTTQTEPQLFQSPVAIASTPGEPDAPPSAQARQSQTTPSYSPVDGAAAVTAGGPRASGRKRRKPAPVQLSLHEQEIKEWYEELRGVDVSFSKRNVTALQALGKRTMTRDDFLNVTAILDDDTWFKQKKVGVDLYWIDYWWENKIIYLHGHVRPLADGPSSPQVTPPGWTAEDEARFVALQSRAKGV